MRLRSDYDVSHAPASIRRDSTRAKMIMPIFRRISQSNWTHVRTQCECCFRDKKYYCQCRINFTEQLWNCLLIITNIVKFCIAQFYLADAGVRWISWFNGRPQQGWSVYVPGMRTIFGPGIRAPKTVIVVVVVVVVVLVVVVISSLKIHKAFLIRSGVWQAVLTFNPYLQISALNCRYLQILADVCNLVADICRDVCKYLQISVIKLQIYAIKLQISADICRYLYFIADVYKQLHICLNVLQISLLQLEISENKLQISVKT